MLSLHPLPLRSPSSAWLALALAAPLVHAGSASAQEACGDSSCPRGFVCQTAPGACADVACLGEECAAPCEPEPYEYCAPAACTSDADCGAEMICAERVLSVCTDLPAADTAEARERLAERDCASETSYQCTPRWQLPCDTAADCGPGFRCEAREQCSVSPSEPGADPADRVEADVECTPSGERACIPEQTSCNADADCPASWTCAASGGAACSDSPAGLRCAPEPDPLCQPPYSNLSGGGRLAQGTVELDSARNDDAAHDLVAGDSDAISSASAGGCSTTGSPTTSSSGLALSVLGLAAWLGRRRAALARRARE